MRKLYVAFAILGLVLLCAKSHASGCGYNSGASRQWVQQYVAESGGGVSTNAVNIWLQEQIFAGEVDFQNNVTFSNVVISINGSDVAGVNNLQSNENGNELSFNEMKTLGKKLDHEGDPYALESQLGGGGTITSMLYHLDFADAPQNMSDAPLLVNKTNSVNGMLYKAAAFDKDQRLLSGFYRFRVNDNWSSNLNLTIDMFNEGATNLTSEIIYEYHQGDSITAGTGTVFTIPENSVSDWFRVTEQIALTGIDLSKDLYFRAGMPNTNAVTTTRTSTLYSEGYSCEFLY